MIINDVHDTECVKPTFVHINGPTSICYQDTARAVRNCHCASAKKTLQQQQKQCTYQNKHVLLSITIILDDTSNPDAIGILLDQEKVV